MPDKKPKASENRARRGQSLAAGDAGHGRTNVSAGAQGISNRRGDRGTAHERAGGKSRAAPKKNM